MADHSPPTPASGTPHGPLERMIENTIFASRWLMAPVYLGLALSLLLILAAFVKKAAYLVVHALSAGSDETIVGILSLVDLSLMANLVIMVVLSGYENFVSRFDLDAHRDRPDWMDHVGFSDLKMKLMTSIVAISAIHVLEDFMHIDQKSDRDLAWGVGLHMAFIVSGLLLALMDRLSGAGHDTHS